MPWHLIFGWPLIVGGTGFALYHLVQWLRERKTPQ